MKNKCALLLKIQRLQTLPLNRLRYSHDSKERSRALLMGVSVGLVGLVLIFYSLLFAAGCVMAGLAGVIPPLVITASSLLTLATTLIKSNGLLFGFKDYDLLLSLPVRSRDVIASRLIALYLLDLVPTVVFAAPALVVYGMAVGAGIVTWILLFFSLLLAPLLPLVIGAFLSGLIALLTARLRRRSVLTSVLSLAAMMLFMAGAFAIPQMEGADLSALAEQMSAMISRVYPPAALFAQAAEGNVLSFLLLVLVSLGAAALFVLLFAKVFSWLNSALSARRSSGHFRLGAQRAASPLRALYLKELKRLVSCPVYLMNCGVGPLMVVLLGIGSFFLPSEQKELAGPLLLRAAPLAAAFFVGMESTTAAALSLEGRNRWILYSSPVDTRTIFNAKIAVGLTASAPAVILGGPLLTLGLGGGPVELLLMMAVPAVYAVLSAVVGLAVNLKFPNYEWTTETAVVKQGSAVLVSMLIGIGAAIVPFILVFALAAFPAWLPLGIWSLLLLAGSYAVYRRLIKVRLYW